MVTDYNKYYILDEEKLDKVRHSLSLALEIAKHQYPHLKFDFQQAKNFVSNDLEFFIGSQYKPQTKKRKHLKIMERKYFTFYRSFADSIFEFDEKTQFDLLRAIIKYSLYDEEIKLEGVAKSVWHLIKPILDSSKKNYENGCKGAEYGSLGGRPKTPKKPKENPEETPTQTPIIENKEKNKDNEEKKIDDEVLNIDDDNRERKKKADKSAARSQFSKPTIEECFAYCSELGLSTYDYNGQQKSAAQVTAEKFWDYFESNGWKVGGRATMKDWKSALRNWVRREKDFKPNNQKTEEQQELENEFYYRLFDKTGTI